MIHKSYSTSWFGATDNTDSEQVSCSIGQTEAVVGGGVHTLVTKLSINLPFWEAAAA